MYKRQEQRYLAKEVANNRISLINTIEKSSKPIDRTGQMIMGGQKWIWDESIVNSQDDNFFEYKISVKLDGSETYIYSINGYYTK